MRTVLFWLFSRTLNNVWFGIVLMVLVAGYVTVGSAFADVREFFEMDEMAFFSAWPLQLMMVLLVANLVTVSFMRIPFTPPRYGVWMIHAGIVILIYGMAYYFSFKQEGLALIRIGETASTFYDRWERSLYVRVDGVNTRDELVLRSLPRFYTHDQRDGSRGRLSASDLRGLEPRVVTRVGGEQQSVPLHQMVGHPDPIRFDVVGFWPFAEIMTSWVETPRDEKAATGIRVEARGADGEVLRKFWLVSGLPSEAGERLSELELEHRHVLEEIVHRYVEAARRIHLLEIEAPGHRQVVAVEIGQTVTLGESGYEISVEEFDPKWQTIDRQTVQMLTLMVRTPTQTFRRQVISGREQPTDWRLGEPGVGPMGRRQTEPLDRELRIRYEFADPLRLMPVDARVKRTFVTTPESMWLVATSVMGPTRVTRIEDGAVSMVFAGESGERTTLSAERVDRIRRVQTVVEVPVYQRDRTTGQIGIKQVTAVRVSSGAWSEVVLVPFVQWALMMPWNGGEVKLPGSERVIQLHLGMRKRAIAPDPWTGVPSQVRLDDFTLVKYAGGTELSGLHRDFQSEVTITEPSGRVREVRAKLNEPIYFGGTPLLNLGDTYWTLFQAQWDPEGQRFTVLGVGNRPGVWVMTFGGFLMTAGMLYAFYVKPIVIRRMKAKAIAQAGAKPRPVRRPVMLEPVEGRVSV